MHRLQTLPATLPGGLHQHRAAAAGNPAGRLNLMRVPLSKIARPGWGIAFDTRGNSADLSALSLPERVCVPLQQHIGSAATPVVKPGDRVLTGQPLARAAANRLGAAVHAPLAGRVQAIARQPGPGRTGLAVSIESDGTDERWPGYTAHRDPLRLSTSALRSAVVQGGIVGLGGATFPAGVKLNRGSGVDTLILNGVECEPVISCDDALMRTDVDAMLLGAQIMLRILEADSCIVALKDGMADALQTVTTALQTLADDRFSIAILPPVYPAGGEAQLIELLTGREIPAGGLPWDSGAICQNVATAAAVAHLLRSGEPLISRIVTVTGAVVAPANFRVRIGTPISHLIAAAGGYTDTSSRQLIMGGPMMGIELPDDSLPVVKATNCIYVPTIDELPATAAELPCIRCGDCATACPAHLMPQLLLQAQATSDTERMQSLGLQDCIECGCCDYVCPSKIPLTRRFVAAKQELWDIAFEKRRAAKARERIAARTTRQQRQQQEQADQLAAQTHNVSDTDTAHQKLQELLQRTGADREDPS